MVILDLWGISFHPEVVVGLGNDLLFNSILGPCVLRRIFIHLQVRTWVAAFAEDCDTISIVVLCNFNTSVR